MVKQHYGNDLGLSLDEMESVQISANASTPTQPRYNDISHMHPVHLNVLESVAK